MFIVSLLMLIFNVVPETRRQNGMAQCFMVRPHKNAARATSTAQTEHLQKNKKNTALNQSIIDVCKHFAVSLAYLF